MEGPAHRGAALADRALSPCARRGEPLTKALAGLLLVLLIPLAACDVDLETGKGGRVIAAHVTRVVEIGTRTVEGTPPQPFERLEVELDESLYRGDRVELQWGGRGALNYNGLLNVGDHVFVSVTRDEDGRRTYTIEEIERFPELAPFAIALVVALLLVARLRGLASIVGLAGGIGVFLLVVVPAVRRGDDPLLATTLATLAVLVVSVFVVHGLSRKSTAALVGAAVTLVGVAALAALGLRLEHLTGLGSQEAVLLVVSTEGTIDMPKLVLAGMIVGSLGALVDMSVGQASATFEIAAVDARLRGRELYGRAINVGLDHIGSLVNTLALAYFGAALPLVLLLSLGNAPLALGLNSETIAVSLLSVLVASIGLVLCVPLTTVVAVRLVPSRRR